MKPGAQGSALQQLATTLTALADYMAFFEARGTTLSEYYVDVVKIVDVLVTESWKEAQAEAMAKLDAEEAKLKAKEAGSEEEQKQKALQLEQCRIAREKLETAQAPLQQNTQAAYQLSDAERALVEARRAELEAVFEAAQYTSKEGGVLRPQAPGQSGP